MGDASSPKGHPLFLLAALGVPTRSIMTEVVSQNEAVGVGCQYPFISQTKVGKSIPRENQVMMRPAQL